MLNNNKLYEIESFSLKDNEKIVIFKKIINSLTDYHYSRSAKYRRLLDFFNYKKNKIKNLESIPYLPVNLFKEFELKSIKDKDVFKVLLSSGTTGSSPSKIFLDKENANAQSKALSKIMKTVLGNERLPMLIVDKNPSIKNRQTLNARMAAINGFSIFGREHAFLLDDNENINYKVLNNFLNKHNSKKFFIFGFTSIVYQNLVKKLSKNLLKYDFKNGILLHGGGWKKMEKIKISNKIFKEKLFKLLGLANIHNYYGLVEQTGSIFVECGCGYFITSIFSDILIRDKNFKIQKNGSKGFIQLLSTLPTSYPGHSILTEDIGEVIENHKCNCSFQGKRFLVYGRAKEAEIRGCSDA